MGPIDLLVSDVVMPRMQGPELARRLAELRSGVRMLFCSGYTESSTIADANAEGGAYLAKPYNRESLGRAARAVLDSAG